MATMCYLFTLLSIISTVMASSDQVLPVTVGQSVTIKCHLTLERNPELRFWTYALSQERSTSSCSHVTFSFLVTLQPRNGIMIYNEDIQLHIKSRVAVTATFDLTIQNVSVLDSGCYRCGHIYQDAGEQVDNPILLIVTQPDDSEDKQQTENTVTESNKKKVTEEPRNERPLTIQGVLFTISGLLTLIFIVVVSSRSILRTVKRDMTASEDTGSTSQSRYPDYKEGPHHGGAENMESERLFNTPIADFQSMDEIRASSSSRLHFSQISSLLEDMEWLQILRWTADQSKGQITVNEDKRHLLHLIHHYLRRSNNRRHDEVVHIKTDEDISTIRSHLEEFIKRADEKTQGCHGKNDLLLALFCAASLAGMACDENREECTKKLSQPDTYQKVTTEDKPSYVTEESQTAGSCRSLVLEYFFARLLWAEIPTRREEEWYSISANSTQRVMVYTKFLEDRSHVAKESAKPAAQNPYIGPPNMDMYEKLTSSMVTGGEMRAINTRYLTKMIARIDDDINKEIFMYDILLNAIFSPSANVRHAQ